MKSPRFAAPFVIWLNKFKYSQKFILITLLFILPLAITIFLLIVELNSRIDSFGWREKDGTVYLRSLRELLEDVQQHRSINSEYISQGGTAPNEELLRLQSQIDQDFKALEEVDRQYGVFFETTQQVEELKEDWHKLKETASDLKAEESYQRHAQFIAGIRNLRLQVGNTSYLILDPELDSYYMMDTVVVKLPELQELLAQTLIIGHGVVSRQALTIDEKAQLIVLTGQIKSNLEGVKINIDTALANNPAHNLEPLVAVPAEKDAEVIEQFLKLVESKIIKAPSPDLAASEFKTSGDKALKASFGFYDAASPALEILLQARINNLTQREYFITALALVSTVAAFLIGLSMMQAINRPLSQLIEAARQVGRGNLSTRMVITGAGEIGEVSKAFNRMAEQLQASQQQAINQAQRLETVTTLSRRLMAILEQEELLAEVVNQVKDKFNYYHAHIYLLDDKREKLVVAVGTGPAGAEMKARSHSIRLDAPTSLVAHAARTGQVVRVDNVREDPAWLPNKLLPDTQSEMAVPILLEEQVVGVLDVQSDKIAGLTESDDSMLRSLANHLAIAIRNAHQFAQVEAALAKAHELQTHYVVQSWDKTRVAKKGPGRVQFSLGESTTLNEGIIIEGRQVALASEEPTLTTFNSDDDETATLHALVAPIKLRNVPIGDLQFHDINPDRQWTEGELALIYAVIDQVAQVAETLRLLDETQERASRELLISQISNKMRRATDIESLMQIAVSELSRVLEPARTFVQMGPKTEGMPAGKSATNGENGSDQLK